MSKVRFPKSHRAAALAGVFALVLVGLASAAAGTIGSVPTFGTAEPVAFAVGAESVSPEAEVLAVACIASAECVAGGFFADAAGKKLAFTMRMTSGEWDVATVAGFADGVAGVDPESEVTTIDCAAVGECVAGGNFENPDGYTEAFVMTMTGGVWGLAGPVAYGVASSTEPDDYVTSVACAAVGECVAGGEFYNSTGWSQAFVMTMVGGAWGAAEPLAFVDAELVYTSEAVRTMACGAVGECVAGGDYRNVPQYTPAFVVTMTRGVWGQAEAVVVAAGMESPAPRAAVRSVTCASAGECIAGGQFMDTNNDNPAFVMTMSNGEWGEAEPLLYTVTENLNSNASVDSVACAAIGECTAGGKFTDILGGQSAFVMTMVGGEWGEAEPVPFAVGSQRSNVDSATTSVACASTGECVAGGYFIDATGNQLAFVATMAGGVWDEAAPIVFAAGVASLDTQALVNSVACAPSATCVAGGWFFDIDEHQRAFLASAVAPEPDPTSTTDTTTSPTTDTAIDGTTSPVADLLAPAFTG